MYLFVKLWTPKPAWYELPLEARVSFIKKGQETLHNISHTMETIAWMEVLESEAPHKGPYTYCSVYKFYDKYDADVFHKTMVKFKWYDYFEQINVVGEVESPGAVLQRVISLQQKRDA